MDTFWELFTDYTLRNVALGSALLGIVSGVLGCFAVLRRQGLLGDALSHAALPGIAVAYLLTGSKAPLVLLFGAGVAGWIGTLLIGRIVRDTRISEDSALGIVLSTFFGFGILLLTYISKQNDANQAGLDKYLFGQAATLVASNVITMAILGGVALLVVGILYKEFKLLTFDPAFAASLGFNPHRLGILLTTLIVVAVVIGLQTVGVVLMAAMLVGPAVAARQWTHSLRLMIGLAAFFGAAAGVSGAIISVSDANLPTGPMIILSLTTIVIASLLFAPARGIVWDWGRRRRQRTLALNSAGPGSGLMLPATDPRPSVKKGDEQ
ncbi:MAG: metal ABC transporter permease [Herpetosiphonaceae bacterium]|nr:metal ABC transporter permease [Herpetosiphonaceae bacterium]